MAKETLQDAYTKGVTKLNELEKLYDKSPKNGEVRRDLINEISELRMQLTYAKMHLLKTEELEYKAVEQYKNVNAAVERITSIQKILFNYNTLKLNGGDPGELKRLKQYAIDNLAFVDPKYASITDDAELLDTVVGLVEEAEKSREEFSKTLSELDEVNATIKTDVYVDENRPDSDERMSRILEEKQKSEEREKTLNDVEKFKKIIAERNSNWEKVCNLQGVSLNKSKYSRGSKKDIRELQEDIKNREKFIKDFIYEFSQNPNYEINEELKALIGTRDESKLGAKGASLKKPTVKQHLEPILDIEEKLKTGVSPEEEKELKEKKEKMEKRLGKKWLLKLKIDKINSRIRELKQLLKGDISPEEKKKYQEELSKLNGELGVLQKEYGEVLSEIADNVSKIVEGAEKEKKPKLDSDKGKDENDKKGTKQPKDKKQPTGTKQPKDKKQPTDTKQPKDNKQPIGKNNDKLDKTPEKGTRGFTATNIGTSIPATSMQGVSNGNVVPIESLRNTTTSNSKNLPTVKKESLLDKLKARFESKKELPKEKVKPEVLFSIEVGEDVVNQKLSMIANNRVPQVVGKDFYHIIREGDELQYVREPLTNIECNKDELVKKIKEVQEKYVTYYKGLYDQQKGNPLLANPNIIARKLIGFSNGTEKQQRILKVMCSLESAMHPQEAIDVLNGKDTIIFRPGINGKGEYVDLISTDYLDEGSALSQYAGKIKYKSNEPIREMSERAISIHQKLCELSEELSNSEEKANSRDEQVVNNSFIGEQLREPEQNNAREENTNKNLSASDRVKKIRENLGGITNENQTVTSANLENNIFDFPANKVEPSKTDNDKDEMIENIRRRTAPRRLISEETRRKREKMGAPSLDRVVPIPRSTTPPPFPRFDRNKYRKNKEQDDSDIAR